MQIANEREHRDIFLALATAVHGLGCINCFYMVVLTTYISVKSASTRFARFGYNFKFSNTINLLIQLLYNLYAIFVDVLMWSNYARDIPLCYSELRSFIRASAAVPFGWCHSFVYWTFHYIDPRALHDKNIPILPFWPKHLVNTVIPVILILDIFVCRGDPVNNIAGGIVTFIYCMFYMIWLQIIYYMTNYWAVPFLANLSLMMKFSIFLSSMFVVYLFLLLGNAVTDLLWNDDSYSYKLYRRYLLREFGRSIHNHEDMGSEVQNLQMVLSADQVKAKKLTITK
ncbi:uncharacterized protein LOC106661485 [Cimex lectularius]|uniref:Uncharacterized protein n=1 Tax=Cimex lectularius TaxID=79782 RepID=A0A8I6R7A2_CIMLE|nr:uncharacterized protein LOC106661485 [Cimex lectularius]